MMEKRTLFAFFGALLTFISCKIQPFDDIEWRGQQDWTLPLVDTKVSTQDFLDDFDPEAYLQIGADNTYVFHYKGNFIAQSSLDIFASLQNAFFPLGDTITYLPLNFPNGAKVDFVDVKQGKMQWGIRSPDAVVDVTMTMPQLSKNGQKFTTRFTASAFPHLDSLDLTGWRFETGSDTLLITYQARRRDNGQLISLANNGIFQIKDFQFSYVQGYLGQDVFDVPQDSIKLDFFKNWQSGDIRFESPVMTATLDNSFGIPVRSVMRVGEMVAVDGRRLNIQSPLTAGVDVNYPKMNEIGQSKRTVVTLNKSNSNISDLIQLRPIVLNYDIDGLMNPDTSRRTVGFLTDSSAFKLQMDLDLPLHMTAKNFVFNDTVDVSLSKNPEITFVELTVLTDNGLPLDLQLQGYFLDSGGKMIDSLAQKSTLLLRGAPVNSNGLPTNAQTQRSVITVEAERFARIRSASKLILQYGLSTSSNGSTPVRITPNQDVRVRIAARFGYKP